MVMNKSKKEALLKELQKSYALISKYKSSEISMPDPLFTWEDQPLIYPESLFMIQGQSGVFKSRFIESIIQSILSKSGEYPNPLKIKAKENLVACILDTESSTKNRLSQAIRRIEQMSGYSGSTKVPNFYYASLKRLSREDRLDAVKVFLEYIRSKEKDKHMVVVLDVLSDIGTDFNDQKDSFKVIDYLNVLAEDQNCTIIGVIHENPSNAKNIEMKGRGHLGTEFKNKSSLVVSLSLEKDYDIKIRFYKSRDTKKPEIKYARFDENTKSLVLLDKSKTAFFERNVEIIKKSILSQFEEKLINTIPATQFREGIKENSHLSHQICRKLVDEIIDHKTVIEKDSKFFTLELSRTGNKREFSLIELPKDEESVGVIEEAA